MSSSSLISNKKEKADSFADIWESLRKEHQIWTDSRIIFKNKEYIKKDIIIPSGVKYLGGKIDSLPLNCIIDKGVTGSGATTLSILDSNNHQIILMPTKHLVSNKLGWARENGYINNIIFISSEEEHISSVKEIAENIQNQSKRLNGKIKILATYDAISKIIKAIESINNDSNIGMDKLIDYNLVVDEYQELLRIYSYRAKAVEGIIQNFKRFNAYSFITANYTEDCYEAFRYIPIQRFVFEDVQTIIYNVYGLETKSFKGGGNRQERFAFRVAEQLIRFVSLKEMTQSNAHIFLNSTDDILMIVKALVLFQANKKEKERIIKSIRIITSTDKTKKDKGKNESKLIGLNKDLETYDTCLELRIASINTIPNKLNFYTSTMFQGVDLFDKYGETFIVTNLERDFTKADIITSLPQIVGRIRNQINLLKTSPTIFYNYSMSKCAIKKSNHRESKNLIEVENYYREKVFLELNNCSAYNNKTIKNDRLRKESKNKFLKSSLLKYNEEEDIFEGSKNYITSILYDAKSILEFDENITAKRKGEYDLEKLIPDQRHNPSVKQIYMIRGYIPDEGNESDESLRIHKMSFSHCIKHYHKIKIKETCDIERYTESIIINRIPEVKNLFDVVKYSEMKELNLREKAIMDLYNDRVAASYKGNLNIKIHKNMNLKKDQFVTKEKMKTKILRTQKNLRLKKELNPVKFLEGTYLVREGKKTINHIRKNGYYVNMVIAIE